jgi:predicted phosphate transport protein (TIGR00153 family)
MQEQMRVVQQCAEQAIPLFEALQREDRESLLAIKERIFELEHEADTIKNEIRSRLPKSLFMPVDRRDLLDILNAQDNIADAVQDVAEVLALPKMKVPAALLDGLVAYVKTNVDAVKQCSDVINELDELLEMGFRGRAADRVEDMVARLGKIESETDSQGEALLEALFDHEDELKPLSVLLSYKLIELIGGVANYAEDVGDRLRLLIAR